MVDIAKHIRIFITNPTDEYVSKRITAINAIEAVIKKKTNISDIYEFINGLLDALETPDKPNDFVNAVSVPALKKSSAAFVPEEESLQLLTCTLLATAQYLEKTKSFGQKPTPDFIMAVAFWNALSFAQPLKGKEKLETLRKELIAVATKIATDISLTSRERKETKLRSQIVLTENTFASVVSGTEASYGKLVDAFRFNAYLDREEIDVLWWVLGGWSDILDQQLSTLNPVQSSVISSLEIGNLLKRFPSKAHTYIACRNCELNTELNGTEIREQLEAQIDKIISALTKNEITTFPKIFPISSLIISKDKVPGLATKRTLHEWAARLLVEFSLTNINNFAE
ncbi:GTPase-associated system all-helical protein GASH [Pedobacter arcticus]|uniref:GTPase-associated system all-helical protein GASH n=1 Tax=Pedobacter arcticus TaxID=752140 RepID=UPI0002F9F22C|nr:GTPase-associated system all-helical protein GASH [Pedobacter arcticus]